MFATELPAEELGLEGMMLLLFMVLTFGWIGSPGNYMAFAWGCKQYHEAATPERQIWHDAVPFRNLTFTDDTILVEPEIGIRPQLSAQANKRAIHVFFGPDALNEEKMDEEGEFRISHLIWGMRYDTESRTIAYP
jgi:hypothetical protein